MGETPASAREPFGTQPFFLFIRVCCQGWWEALDSSHLLVTLEHLCYGSTWNLCHLKLQCLLIGKRCAYQM